MKIRIIYLSLVISFASLALFTRTDIQLPYMIKVYGGDTLWAVMTYFLICVFLTKKAGLTNFILALLLSAAVESSQLYQAAWILEIRATNLGGLLLGHAFKVSDLACYIIGNATAFIIDSYFRSLKPSLK